MATLTARKLQDVAAAIRAARETTGLSQEQLAKRLNFSRDYMVDLESGKGSVYTMRLFRTFHELGITMTLAFQDHDGQS